MLQRFIDTIRDNRGATVAAALIVVLALAGAALIGLPPLFMVGLLVAFFGATRLIYDRRTRHLEPRPSSTLATSALLGALAVFLVAQAVPYGRDHSNPPVTAEPDWATPQTRELMVRACFDCHSNEVVWPWYSNVAPFSWAVWKHVEDGRNKVNYSEWDQNQRKADESWEETKKGSMPPAYYTFGGVHPAANLTEAELAALLDGLADTPGLSE
ncbi:MAG: heme-binding domain-containing protein [Acidimicrobiia bacterium]